VLLRLCSELVESSFVLRIALGFVHHNVGRPHSSMRAHLRKGNLARFQELNDVRTRDVQQPEWIRIVERRYVGALITQLREEKLPAVRAALIDILGLK
jgi:hypothetical protein